MISIGLLLPLLGIFIAIIGGALTVAFPQLTEWLLNSFNMADNIYSLLIEIPRPQWNQSIYFFGSVGDITPRAAVHAAASNTTVMYGTQLNITLGYANSTATAVAAAANATSGYSGSLLIGAAMTQFYAASRLAALFLLVVVVTFAAMAFVLQNFRVVSEGTAARILTGSVMAGVFILIFPPLYDTVAAFVNALTYPSPSGILQQGMINEILHHASQIIVSNGSDVGSALMGIIMNTFLFIFVVISYISIVVMGVLRTFFIGAAFALMPILLVLRLVPYADRVADLFIQVIPGGILSSVIVSLFFSFGYSVVMSPAISGIMKTIIALGVLLSASLMLTFLIPHLGSMMSSIATAITGAATGAAVGGVAVAAGAAAAIREAVPALQPLWQSGMRGAAVLRAFGAGAGGAAAALGATAPRLVPGAGAGYAIPSALSVGRGIGSLIQGTPHDEIADALILKAAATPHDQEGNPAKMQEWAAQVHTDLLTRPPEVVGAEVGRMTGLKIENPEETGKRVQERIRRMMEMTKDDPEAQNVLLSRIGRSYSAWKDYGVDLEKMWQEARARAELAVKMKAGEKLKDLSGAELKKRIDEEAKKEFEKMREELAPGISPYTVAAAIRHRKANADAVAKYIQDRKLGKGD